MRQMIVGRTVQGCGGGGVLALTEIVVADLVPLNERGEFTVRVVIPRGSDSQLCPYRRLPWPNIASLGNDIQMTAASHTGLTG